MRNNIINLGLIIIIAAIISGCASRCITVSKSADSAQSFSTGFSKLQALPPTTKTLTNVQLQGQVTVNNKKSLNQNFQYQVDWLDENGFSTGQTQAWNPVEIYGNLQKTITLPHQPQMLKTTTFHFVALKVPNNTLKTQHST